jgi:ABC-type bacteriocin/lantibiotic exporter with double-glycine peptidase domain
MSLDTLRKLWRLVAPHRGDFAHLLVLALFTGVLMAFADPIALKLLIESLESGDSARFALLAAIILAIATVATLAGYRMNVVGKRLQNKVHADLCERMADAYFHQPFASATAGGEGYHVNRIHEEARELSRAGGVLAGLLARVAQLFAALAVALLFSWKVTLVLLLLLPALVLLSRRYSGRIARTESQRHEAEASFKSLLGRAVSAYRGVLMFGLRPSAARQLRSELEKPLELGYENTRLASRYGALSGLYFSYSELAVILVAGSQVIAGALSIGALFGFMRAYQIVMQQVNALAGLVPTLARLRAAGERADAYLAAVGAPQSEVDRSPRRSGLLVAERLVLGWHIDIPAPALSFCLRPGQSMLVEGANGSGKSTLALFASGFLEPLGGRWARPPMDRVSASFADAGFLPGQVSQSFEGLGDDAATREQIRAVQEAMGVADLLESDSRALSRGQAARLQVALALCKDADLYVFDEPFANVDEPGKDCVAACIRRFTKGRAFIVITHGDSGLLGGFDLALRLGASEGCAQPAVGAECSA